eukprot:NODE_18_length_40692_cov_0.469183.p14 type:complete len:310 gc:universal NODE_18_length_40692_cov_0.469183:35012-34083(-)
MFGFDSWKQFISVIVCTNIFFTPIIYVLLTFSNYWIIAVVYTVWMLVDKSPFNTGRYSIGFRNAEIFKHLAEYFPSQVIVDEPLKDKQYLFSYSPHGIIGTNCFCTLGTNGNNFARHYKRPIRVVTIDFNFYMPIFRDVFILLGYLSCSKKTMELNLKQGNSLAVVLGGAQEVTHYDKYNINVIINKRMGFFKLALENGVDVVPVFTFGETDIYKVYKIENKNLLQIQSFIKNYFGFLLTVFHGLFAILPYKEPLTTIVGRPIAVKKTSKPTTEQIQALQELYKKELKWVFDKYQPIYGKHVKTMNVVD